MRPTGCLKRTRNILKIIGILNLIDADGVLRATPAMIQFALHDPLEARDAERFAALQERLNRLVDGGFVVHRTYSDEYRVWQGTDVDIDARVREVATGSACRCRRILQRAPRQRPARRGRGRQAQPADRNVALLCTAISHEAGRSTAPRASRTPQTASSSTTSETHDARPAVNSPLPGAGRYHREARGCPSGRYHLMALEELLDNDTIDHVAAREIAERRCQSPVKIGAQLDQAFSPRQPESRPGTCGAEATETAASPTRS